MTLELNGYRLTSLSNSERELVRQFAVSTIFTNQILLSVLADANKMQAERDSMAELTSRYAVDLEAAQARIGEDEATIQFKDNQLTASKKTIDELKENNQDLISQIKYKSETCKTYEGTITKLQEELKGYRAMTINGDSRS